MAERPVGYLQTADRALEVLMAFTAEHPEWGVTDLARHLSFDKSQVQRLLATLAARRFLVADPDTRRYRLGPALVGLGRLAEDSDGTLAAVRDLLAPLAQRTGESALFVVPDGNRYRCAAAVDGPGPLRYRSIVGEVFPGHGGASGHAIFAFLDPSRIATLFEDELAAINPNTPRSRAALERIHEQVRRDGIAVSLGEYDERVEAVAAPVFAQGAVVGAISVIGPRQSIAAHVDAIIAEVGRAARRATAALGNETVRPATAVG